ncbi:SDR family oxidoreductase [Paraburkholderia bengalensis]|uniref:SDR family oxidoreductase n=1 Tax=Paraburkholderia bengalensis TaxID=2747562 RepID=A0ABU8IQI6_9BURK
MEFAQYSDLKNKIAVVTGASGGIGRALVHALISSGATVIATDLTTNVLAEAFGESDPQPALRALDVSDTEQTNALAKSIAQEYGHLDIWINNAGVLFRENALEYKASAWQKTLDVNLSGTFYGAQAAARVMVEQGSGSILNLASYAGIRARHNCPDYASTKAAAAHLTRCLASEWGPLGLRVNAIAPGYIETPMTRWLRDDAEAAAQYIGKTPVRRLGKPTDIAQAALYLCSEASSFVTGHVLVVDGGFRTRNEPSRLVARYWKASR